MNKYLITIILLAFSIVAKSQFVHPGCLHKKSDLDRMKYMVDAGIEPYFSTYNKLKNFAKASSTYTVQGNDTMTIFVESKFNSDAAAAYLNSLMWYITGDSLHAKKCVEIFNAWVNLQQTSSFSLISGNSSWKMIEGAEIIKSTYAGWSTADINKFKAMLVYPGYSNTTIPTGNKTFYWNILNGDPGRHGNQDAIAFRAMISMGVFLDNKIMYDRALNYFKGLPHRADDIPYASGPGVSGAVISDNPYFTNYKNTNPETIEDYGFNGVLNYYFWENGQCQESSRDQQHTYFGLSIFQMLAEVAWNQGDNAWNYLDNRLLKAFEFNSKYNISYIQSYLNQPTPWEPTVASGEFIERTDRTGRWKSKTINPYSEGDFTNLTRGKFLVVRPVYEQAMAHFAVRMGFNEEQTLWTGRGLELFGIEENGWATDHPGWGGLTFHRPDGCAGDPISGFKDGNPVFAMNTLPMTIEAENYDQFAGVGESRTYHDTDASNTGGEYRLNEGVDIATCSEGGYMLSSLENGEWLSYSIYAPETAQYAITLRYAASQAGGTIKFCFAGEDTTNEVAVPYGSPNSTSDTDWQTMTIVTDAVIYKGVQSLKVYIGGVSNAFKINNFTITKSGIAKQEQSITFFKIPYKIVGSADFAPEAIASSSLPVSYTSSDTTVATIVNGKIHLKAEGTTTISALQSGNEYYFAAPKATRVLAVVPNTTVSVSLPSIDDSYVNGGATGTNYGTATAMVTKGGTTGRYAYLKFDLSTVPGPVVSAKLRIYQRTSYAEERSVYDVADDSWTETTINWNNKPAYTNNRATITTKSAWNEWDVSSYVAQESVNDSLISMVVINPSVASVAGIDFYAKENINNAPVLVVTSFKENLAAIESIKYSPINVYPNPTNGVLNINMSENSSSASQITVSLFNLRGMKVKEIQTAKKDFFQFDLSNIANGMYYIQIKQGDTQYYQKVLKK